MQFVVILLEVAPNPPLATHTSAGMVRPSVFHPGNKKVLARLGLAVNSRTMINGHAA